MSFAISREMHVKLGNSKRINLKCEVFTNGLVDQYDEEAVLEISLKNLTEFIFLIRLDSECGGLRKGVFFF